jgi:hypothetical protein
MIRLQILWGDGRTAADSHDRSLPPVAARFPPTAFSSASSGIRLSLPRVSSSTHVCGF